MRRKSFISPCKELNTDQLFKKVHLKPANCKLAISPDASSLWYRHNSNAGGFTRSQNYLRQHTPKNTTASSSTKHVDSGCLKISKLLGLQW